MYSLGYVAPEISVKSFFKLRRIPAAFLGVVSSYVLPHQSFFSKLESATFKSAYTVGLLVANLHFTCADTYGLCR